jgi:hypothetical protein
MFSQWNNFARVAWFGKGRDRGFLAEADESIHRLVFGKLLLNTMLTLFWIKYFQDLRRLDDVARVWDCRDEAFRQIQHFPVFFMSKMYQTSSFLSSPYLKYREKEIVL